MQGEKLKKSLEKIRKIFIRETFEKIQQRREVLATQGNKEISDDIISSFFLMFHGLKGTGQTLGFGDISALAEEVLEYIESLQNTQSFVHPRQVILTLKGFLFRLETLLPETTPDNEPANDKTCLANGDVGEILIVDDDNALLLAIKERLEMEGFDVKTSNSGAQTLETLSRHPYIDIIVLDIIMPDMGGLELCRRIRQNESWQNTPIIFLTAESSLDSKLFGFEAGADDYLAKPFALEELVVRVKTMFKRRNYYRELCLRDSLTGAFNRRYLSQRIAEEIARCGRTGQRFSIFILDLDDFKEINDKYGHLAGDKVLVELAKFLRSETRKSDVVSRYGGEEFVILFPDTPLDASIPVVYRLKNSFTTRMFNHCDKSFFVSFSIGAAEYPGNGKNEEELIGWADKGLYQAKSGGKSKIIYAK
ncbi:MAG: diguanylate cyclase [Firmicutes bacterium]|nr:diguanylate cyclase [Bacillota bacterium]